MSDVIFILAPLVWTGWWLVMWFDFTLPCWLAGKIRLLPWMKEKFPADIADYDRSRFETWTWENLHPDRAYWMSCPGCFSTRAAAVATPVLAAAWVWSGTHPSSWLPYVLWCLCSSAIPLWLFMAGRKDNPELRAAVTLPADKTPTAPHLAEPGKLTMLELMERSSKRGTAWKKSGNAWSLEKPSSQDAQALAWLAAVDRHAEKPDEKSPCETMENAPKKCAEMMQGYLADLKKLGSDCPSCERGAIRRYWWDRVASAMYHHETSTVHDLGS